MKKKKLCISKLANVVVALDFSTVGKQLNNLILLTTPCGVSHAELQLVEDRRPLPGRLLKR